MAGLRVLISGAGIAGNALAYLLARIGATVVVLDRASSLPAQGQNIDMQGAALTAMKHMGLLQALKDNNTTEKGTVFIDQHGKQYASFSIDKDSAGLTKEYEIIRGDLARLLYDKAVREPNVSYQFGIVIEKIIENDEKSVKVQLSDGTEQTFDLAVAADGQWSKLRKLAFPAEDTTIIDKGAYCAYFTGKRIPEDNDSWRIYTALRSRMLMIRPDPHGTIRFLTSLMPANDKQKQRWQDALRAGPEAQKKLIAEEFADAGWQAERILKDMVESTDFYCNNLQQVRMKQWHRGRIVCVGDAAWAPTLLTGQGTTLAITGAYVLAGELSRQDPAAAFEAYDARFHPHVLKVQSIPWFVPRIAHPSSAVSRFMLQSLIRTASAVMSMPLLRSAFAPTDPEKDDNGFPLPSYPELEAGFASIAA